MFNRWAIRGLTLDAAGLVAIADLKTIVYRTALTGTASYLDVFFLAPGIHQQQAASEVNGNEYPATAAMTTGYVFRVENQATVSFLQRVGKPGHLTTVHVDPPLQAGVIPTFLRAEPLASVCYLTGVASTIAVVLFLGATQDWWGVGVIGMLMTARLLNVIVIKRRSQKGWKGAKEEGVKGDLMILVSQDRWLRMQGLVDDIKSVTAGQWLREISNFESFLVSFSTLLVCISAAFAGNASTLGSILVAFLLLVSAALLGLANISTTKLTMFGNIVRVDGKPKQYGRRLNMVHELLVEHPNENWAIGLGMIVPPAGKSQQVTL